MGQTWNEDRDHAGKKKHHLGTNGLGPNVDPLDAQLFMAIPRIHLGTRRFLTPSRPPTVLYPFPPTCQLIWHTSHGSRELFKEYEGQDDGLIRRQSHNIGSSYTSLSICRYIHSDITKLMKLRILAAYERVDEAPPSEQRKDRYQGGSTDVVTVAPSTKILVQPFTR